MNGMCGMYFVTGAVFTNFQLWHVCAHLEISEFELLKNLGDFKFHFCPLWLCVT